jgi:hypothetical protein
MEDIANLISGSRVVGKRKAEGLPEKLMDGVDGMDAPVHIVHRVHIVHADVSSLPSPEA